MKKQQGFTLIEVVISIAILSIVLVTLVSVMNRTVATAAESSALTSGVMLAQEKLSIVGTDEGGIVPIVGTSAWESDDRYPRFTFRVVVEETPLMEVMKAAVEVRHDNKAIFSLDSYLVKR